MKKRYLIITVISLISFIKLSAQETINVNDLLKKTANFYEQKEAYKFNTSYKLFKEYTKNEIVETYEGKVIKTNDIIYSKIHNTEFLQFEESFLKVNHLEKAMLYTTTKVISESISPIAILDYIKTSFKSSEVIAKRNSYVIEFLAKDLNFLPYKKLQIYIDKNDFKIQKQVIFLANQIFVKDDKGKEVLTNPRLEITIFNFSDTAPKISGKYKLSNYITKSNNKVVVSKKYKNYNIIQN